MNHEELLSLVAKLSAANLKLRETIDDQRQHLEHLTHQLAQCHHGYCECNGPDDCDGRCQ